MVLGVVHLGEEESFEREGGHFCKEGMLTPILCSGVVHMHSFLTPHSRNELLLIHISICLVLLFWVVSEMCGLLPAWAVFERYLIGMSISI
jgi:hypothetical protein